MNPYFHQRSIVAMNTYCPPKVQRLIGAISLGHQLFDHVSALLLPFWGEEETRTAESRKPPRCTRSLLDYVYFGSRSRTSLQSTEEKLKIFRISDILIWSPMTAISSFCNIYHVLCRLLRRTFNLQLDLVLDDGNQFVLYHQLCIVSQSASR